MRLIFVFFHLCCRFGVVLATHIILCLIYFKWSKLSPILPLSAIFFCYVFWAILIMIGDLKKTLGVRSEFFISKTFHISSNFICSIMEFAGSTRQAKKKTGAHVIVSPVPASSGVGPLHKFDLIGCCIRERVQPLPICGRQKYVHRSR